MPKKSTRSKEESTPMLSGDQIVAAATNNPALATDEVSLGDRTFKILHLEYDQYLEFTGYLQPMLKSIAGLVTQRAGVSVPGIEVAKGVDADHLMQFCAKSLPEMAAIVLNMQATVEDKPADKVDIKWVKKHGKTPWALADIVMKQVHKNRMIQDFLDFFVQVLPTLIAMQRMQRIANPASTTAATPSS